MPRLLSMPQRLFHALGFPVFVLYTLVLHAWAVWMAFRFGESVGAGWATLALPVASWVWSPSLQRGD